MKIFLVTLLSAMVLCACTKSSDRPADESTTGPYTTAKKFGVNFNLEDFRVSYSDARNANKEMAAKDYLKYLFYGVFDSTGSLVSKVEQGRYSGDIVTGRFSDSLASGRYTIVFAGGSDSTCVESYFSGKLTDFKLYYLQDIFEKKISLNLNNDTSLSNIVLDRITADLSINISDSVFPTNLQRIDILVDSMYSAFSVFSQQAVNPFSFYTYAYSRDYQPWAAVPVFRSIQCFGFANKPTKVTIRGYDKNSVVIAEKIVGGVYLNANKRTTLKGRLFPIPYAPDFSVTMDSSYADNTTINF